MSLSLTFFLFFFNDTPTTEIYTLSLHDALPILPRTPSDHPRFASHRRHQVRPRQDRKSTRLNSSHRTISYAVFCLKKKNLKNSSFFYSSAARTSYDRVLFATVEVDDAARLVSLL